VDVTETRIDQPGAIADAGQAGAAVAPNRRGPTPGAAAILSLLFPGLGQILNGAIRRGFFIALPTLILIGAIGMAISGGTHALLATLVQPSVVFAVLVINLVYGVYHLVAIGDAFWIARGRGSRPASTGRSVGFLALALTAALGLHGLIGSVGLDAYSTVSTVFVPPGGGYTIPTAGFGPETAPPGGLLDEPTPTPGPAWSADGRLNLLLIGGDAGPGRTLLRTDTMILLSVDVATGRAAMFGIPRNLLNAPLAPEDAKAFKDGKFPGLLNALYVYAYMHPKDFPDGGCEPSDSDACGATRGFRAITGSIQQLTGVPLDGAVVVNLNGFVDLVDAIGGLWINTEHVYDTAYPLENGNGYVTINIKAGCQHLSGHLALAYARSRHQDSDYGRMGRQQQVLIALLHNIDPLSLLPKVPDLLEIAKNNLTLAIPAADIGSLAALASQVDPDSIQRLEFAPPTFREFLTDKEVLRIQTMVRTVFATPPSPSTAPAKTPKPSATPKDCGPA